MSKSNYTWFPGIPGGVAGYYANFILTNVKYSCVVNGSLCVGGISAPMAAAWGVDPEQSRGRLLTEIIGASNGHAISMIKCLSERKKGNVVIDINFGDNLKMPVEVNVIDNGDDNFITLCVKNPSEVDSQYKPKPYNDDENDNNNDSNRVAYTKYFERVVDGMALSAPDGEILSFNRAFLNIFKYPIAPFTEVHIMKDNLFVDPQDWENIKQLIKEKGTVNNYETDMKTRDGSIITVVCAVNMFRDGAKNYYEILIRDITEQKKLEKELIRQNEALEEKVRKRTAVLERQRNKLLSMNRQCKATSATLKSILNKTRTLFNAITDPVAAIDRDFNVLLMNRSENFEGKKCYQVLFDRDEVCKKCPAAKAIRTKKPASTEMQKGDRYYQMQCYPVADNNGKIDGVIEWAKDITAEKHFSHQMLQADRLASLGQLVSGIGHEINNPNTFILGNMKILKEALDDMLPLIDEYYKSHPDLKIARLKYPFFREHIKLLADDMESGAERIRTIVYDLRKFGRKNEDKFDDDIAVNTLIERSIRLIANQVKRKANITTDLAKDLPLIRANGIGLEQVFVNIMMNASEAMEGEEKGNISISSSLNQEGDSVVISFKDDGYGMDEDTMRHIFDPFFSTKRNRGGTGLGLSIAYRIIKEHDGEIDVDSAPGKGTAFTITIPASAHNTDGGGTKNGNTGAV